MLHPWLPLPPLILPYVLRPPALQVHGIKLISALVLNVQGAYPPGVQQAAARLKASSSGQAAAIRLVCMLLGTPSRVWISLPAPIHCPSLALQDLWSERALELRRNKSQRQRQKEQEQQREAAKERAEAQLLQRSPLAGKAAALATSGLRATALGAGGGAGRCCR